ncbi:MAG TPA: DUF503 domain-containing protein [Armatimonadetes bacterium]|nr:DUF503 domain-containing protein [Armatimonadota bacterium]
MFIGACEIELYLHGCQSLKEKRQVLRSLLDRLQNQFNASIAEVDYQDLWQRAAIGVAVVGNDKVIIERVLNRIITFTENHPGVELVDYEIEIW